MKGSNRVAKRTRRSGQTLIIAILILGILLITGLAFARVVSGGIESSRQYRERAQANTIGVAVVKDALVQLRVSEKAADFRPEPTPPTDIDGAGFSRDPDSLYLRQGSGLTVTPDPTRPTETVVDRGGPDFQGAFSRSPYDRGRGLLRIRYAPADYDAFLAGRAMREPGKARSYLIIESIGRSGEITTAGRIDPSLLLKEAVKVAAYADANELLQSVGRMKALDASLNPSTRKVRALASLGYTEYSRFIFNRENSSRSAQIGFLDGADTGSGSAITRTSVGVTYNGAAVSVPSIHGLALPAPIAANSANWSQVPGLGSIRVNGNLELFGSNQAAVNSWLGEGWLVSGEIRPGDNGASLTMTRYDYNRGTDQWVSSIQTLGGAAANPSFVSSSPNFSTLGAVLRDGASETDQIGGARGIGRQEPPSIQEVDPRTGQNRYLNITRGSGVVMANGQNSGEYGYGGGVFIDSAERGNMASEDPKRLSSAVRSLPNDWLNENNAASQGWQGPYYVPLASYLHLLPDGFEIIRDSRSRRPTWINPATGASTGSRVCRYRLRNVGGQVYILNSIQHPALVNAPASSVSNADFQNNGQAFNGVIYFNGDVRTRGVIPTDVQLTVVAMGSVYIEGSIVRGILNTMGTRGAIDNSLITGPSRSMLMLMARDYVTINTTQFFGPEPGASPAIKDSDILPDTPNAAEFDQGEMSEMRLMTQFLFNPNSGTPANPSSWAPYANNYADLAGNIIRPNIMLTSSADDGGPGYLSMDVMPSPFADPTAVGARTYQFSSQLDFGTGPFVFNAAASAYGFPTNLPAYGLGDPAINAYPKFETVAFPLLSAPTLSGSGRLINSGAPIGDFQIGLQDPTLFRLRLAAAGNTPPKNWLLARSSIAPHDIRIEAAMVAEEGSFFVIPGPWFNSNASDTRAQWTTDQGSVGAAQANLLRFQRYGNTPSVPFYQEPLDVRVQIIGAVSENMPAPISAQSEWMKKWGWIPRAMGSSGNTLAAAHTLGTNPASQFFPNFTITYDPALGSGTADGANPIRVDQNGWILPPLPRLPVSPTLAYFGDMNQ